MAWSSRCSKFEPFLVSMSFLTRLIDLAVGRIESVKQGFNGHYNTWCYLRMMAFVSFNDEAEQYLCAAVLRTGNVTAAVGRGGDSAPPDLADPPVSVRRTHSRAPRLQLRPSGCAGLAGRRAQPGIRGRDGQQCGIEGQSQTGHAPGPQAFPAEWENRTCLRRSSVCGPHLGARKPGHPQSRDRRAEGKAPKDNPRSVISNMKQSPQWLCEQVYCQRGEIENRIKELHDLEIDPTGCSQFWANQFRVLLTARLRADAGVGARTPSTRVAPALKSDAARTTAEPGRACGRFCAPRARAPARLVPLSCELPQSGAGARRPVRLSRHPSRRVPNMFR